jgi:uncharacterized cupredoxin-like copper-binding protein
MRLWTIALAFIAPLAVAPVTADTLDTDSAKQVLNRTWVQNNSGGPAEHYWTWKPDGTVCIRLYDAKQPNCDDAGQWTLEAGRVCYEIGWWSGGQADKSGCFRIAQPSNTRYQAVRDDGVPLFQFAVLSPGQEPIVLSLRFGMEAGDLKIIPSKLTLQTGTPYKLVITNPSQVAHMLALPEFSTSVEHSSSPAFPYKPARIDVAAGETVEWYFVPTKTGHYKMQAEAGMHGEIVVK